MMQSLGELLFLPDALEQVQDRWRDISAKGQESHTPRVQFIAELFVAAHGTSLSASNHQTMLQMLERIFGDSSAHVQIAALNTICSQLPSQSLTQGSLGVQLLPGWFSVCTSASVVRSLLSNQLCGDSAVLVATLQTVAKLPRLASNLLHTQTPADVSSLGACVNIFQCILFERHEPFLGVELQSKELFSQLVNSCGRDSIHAIAQCLVDKSDLQPGPAMQLLTDDVCEEVIASLLQFVHKRRCRTLASLELSCRTFFGGSETNQQKQRLQLLIKRFFLQKHADYRFARGLVDVLERCWVESVLHDQTSETDKTSCVEERKEHFIRDLLHETTQVWAEPVLIRQGHVQRIMLLSRVICLTLNKLRDDQQHILTHIRTSSWSVGRQESPLSIICRGISTYFDSEDPVLRSCGMAVALSFARVMKQPLAFEDFDDPFPQTDELIAQDVENISDTQESTQTHVCPTPQSEEELRQLHQAMIVKDAPDFDDMQSVLLFFNPGDSLPELFQPESVLGHYNTMHANVDDGYGSDASDLVPFDDAEETEEELRDVPKPRFLRICLDMLRMSPEKEGSFDKQLSALEAIPEILESNPYDAAELAGALVREVLRVENRAHQGNNFAMIREKAMVALCVAQPASTIQTLVTAVQDKEYSLGTRIEVLSCMMATANTLAGGTQAESRQYSGEADKPASDPLPTGMKIIQSRRKRTMRPITTVRNNFSPVAYQFFYPVMHACIHTLNLALPRNVPTRTLPSRALTSISDFAQSTFVVGEDDQAMLAVHMLTALTEFVRCCIPLAEAQVMARDLTVLLRQIDIPANLGLRRAVMLAWYTCVMCLGENVDSLTIDQCVRVARIQLENDPDPKTRDITQGVVKELLDVIDPYKLRA